MPRRKETNEEVSEEEVQQIILDIKSGRYTSCNAAEKATGVNRSLLTRRLNGQHQSRAQAREPQQNLTGPEEKALVQ
ncbi:MAG: hypothetical protein M1823_002170, partial [Watsoniomyces obsoletus]